MIFVLQGDDVTLSRRRAVDISYGMPSIYIDGKSLTVAMLEEQLLAKGLFEEKRAFILENTTKNTQKRKIFEFLEGLKIESTVVVWEDRKVTQSSFSPLKSAKFESFMLPFYYFQFLDGLYPHNKKASFELLQKLLSTYAAEQIHYALLKRLRQLLVLSSGQTTDEISKMPQRQLSNLKRQLMLWKKNSLLAFYDSLRQTEIKLKTGALPVSLSKHLDILLLTKL